MNQQLLKAELSRLINMHGVAYARTVEAAVLAKCLRALVSDDCEREPIAHALCIDLINLVCDNAGFSRGLIDAEANRLIKAWPIGADNDQASKEDPAH